MQVRLTFMSGPRDGESVQLGLEEDSGGVDFGRLPTCAVALSDDPEVSRSHARLTRSGMVWLLEDIGSANGTFVGEFKDERRIDKTVALEFGQVFRVGLTRFQLEPVASEPMLASASAEARIET